MSNWEGILSSGNAAAGPSNSLEDIAIATGLGAAAGGSAGAAGAPIASVSNQEFSKRWVEASLGHELNGRNISEFLSLNGSERTSTDTNDLNLTQARVVESFCDASAIAALTRLHVGYKAQIMDFLVLNNSITAQQKNQMLALMDRVSQYLALAEADTASKYNVEALLLSLIHI